MELLIATGNKKKLEEFQRILEPLGIRAVSPASLGLDPEVEETGETFPENARIKAEAYYRLSGLPAVADDSGLCVDALEGRPGVYSARYHGEDTPYPEKMAALLKELEAVPASARTARFTCAICCVLGEGEVIQCERSCEGLIGHAPAGDGGFGYDPLFYVGDESFASLSPQRKDELSHRGKALRAFATELKDYMARRGTAR